MGALKKGPDPVPGTVWHAECSFNVSFIPILYLRFSTRGFVGSARQVGQDLAGSAARVTHLPTDFVLVHPIVQGPERDWSVALRGRLQLNLQIDLAIVCHGSCSGPPVP